MAPLPDGTTLGIPVSSTKVRFTIQTQSGPRGKAKRSSLKKGRFLVSDAEVSLVTSRRRLFQRPVETKRTFARSQMFDARAEGHRVHFDVHGADGIEQVVLTTFRNGVARRIVRQLPTQLTPAREAERVALASYAERIVALTPNTWVTYALIAINLLVFMAMSASGVGVMSPNAAMTVDWGTNFGPQTLSGQWWRLLTSVFVHFGLFHILLNLFTLYQIGRLAERLYGSARFLGLYLFAGVTGSLTSVFWHPTVNSAGASGAIFGVFGALLVFVLKYRHELPASIARQQRISLSILIAYNLFYGFTQQGIDNGAHLGGLAGGILLGLALARPLSEPARSQRARSSTLLSCALALVVSGAATYRLLEVRDANREELRFVTLVQALGPGAAKISAEGVALMRGLTDTRTEKDQTIRTLAQDVIPQWDKLYASFEQIHLEQRSTHVELRAAILDYLDDNRKLYRLAIELIRQDPTPDPATEAQIAVVTRDMVAHAAAIKGFASTKDSGRQ